MWLKIKQLRQTGRLWPRCPNRYWLLERPKKNLLATVLLRADCLGWKGYDFQNWVWLKIKSEGQTAGLGLCFGIPSCFLSSQLVAFAAQLAFQASSARLASGESCNSVLSWLGGEGGEGEGRHKQGLHKAPSPPTDSNGKRWGPRPFLPIVLKGKPNSNRPLNMLDRLEGRKVTLLPAWFHFGH